MELWIRSQDKEDLIKVNKKVCIMDYGEECFIPILIDDLQVAEYRTKERALEVLDEIQRILHPTVFMSAEINTDDNNWVENGIIYQKYKDNFNIQELSTYVYEMPEK